MAETASASDVTGRDATASAQLRDQLIEAVARECYESEFGGRYGSWEELVDRAAGRKGMGDARYREAAVPIVHAVMTVLEGGP